jgi:UDP-hydrolysing UDP-N-acetyl-D-glucosamine 2-epimerase
MNRDELAFELGLDPFQRWVMLTYHPETKSDLDENMLAIQNIITALNTTENTQIVISKANADYGGLHINQYIEQIATNNSSKYKFYASLGQLRYLSYMKQVQFIIGNSSSGIVEAPFLNIPAINIGDRQKGRYMCQNVIQSSANLSDIKKAIQMAENDKFSKDDCFYWGDGNTSLKVIELIKRYVQDNRR